MGNSSDMPKNQIGFSSLSDSQEDKIFEALSEMTDGKYQRPGVLGSVGMFNNPYPFDRKGNLTKAKKTLKKAERQIDALLTTFRELSDLGLSEKMDMKIRVGRKGMMWPRTSALDLIIDNGIRFGAMDVSILYLGIIRGEFGKYLRLVVETGWPEGRTKSYPFFVAQEIAKIYVTCIGKKPTYGTNNQSASTPFSRAVEVIFEILGVDGSAPDAAIHAAKEYTDESAAEVMNKKAQRRSIFPQTILNGKSD